MSLDVPCVVIRLKNGFQIACIDTKGSELAAFELVIRQGEGHEHQFSELQCSHLCEHLLDRLTSEKYPHYRVMEKFLAQNSIYSNASVDEHETCFILRGLRTPLIGALHFLLMCYVSPWIDPKLLASEKHSIVEELKAQKHGTDAFFQRCVNKILFPDNLALQLSVEDKIKNLETITHEQLMKWVQSLFSPQKTILLLACRDALAIAETCIPILQKITKRYRDVPMPGKSVLANEPRVPRLYLISLPHASQNRVTLVFPLNFVSTSLEVLPVRAWLRILADSTSMYSRLMQLLRTQLKIIYSLHSELLLHPKIASRSYLILDLHCEPDLTRQVMQETVQCMRHLADKGITSTEYHGYCQWQKVHTSEKLVNQNPNRFLQNYRNSLVWGRNLVSNKQMAQAEKLLCTRQYINQSCAKILNITHMITFIGQAC